MTALAAARNTSRLDDHVLPAILSYLVKGATTIYQGGIVVLNAGYAAPASNAAGLLAVGLAEETVVNAGADGAEKIRVRAGVIGPFVNSAAGDAVAQADVGKYCFLVDDQTVAKTGAGARCIAGLVHSVGTEGVFVKVVDLASAQEYPRFAIAIDVPALSAIADADVVARFKPPWPFRIVKTQFQATTPASTAAKLSTLTPKIATVDVTGGVLALTTAGLNAEGKTVDGTAVTALNVGAAGDEITLVASATTAFVEGAGTAIIFFG